MPKVLRLGRVVRDAPAIEFNDDTLVGTITGTITTIPEDNE